MKTLVLRAWDDLGVQELDAADPVGDFLSTLDAPAASGHSYLLVPLAGDPIEAHDATTTARADDRPPEIPDPNEATRVRVTVRTTDDQGTVRTVVCETGYAEADPHDLFDTAEELASVAGLYHEQTQRYVVAFEWNGLRPHGPAL